MADQDALPRREREVLHALFLLGEGAVEEIRAILDSPPGYSAVRAMLARLEAKGHVSHRVDAQRYIYSPTLSRNREARSALRQVVRVFFKGSAVSAATALLDLADGVDEQELRQLEEMIERVRHKEK